MNGVSNISGEKKVNIRLKFAPGNDSWKPLTRVQDVFYVNSVLIHSFQIHKLHIRKSLQ